MFTNTSTVINVVLAAFGLRSFPSRSSDNGRGGGRRPQCQPERLFVAVGDCHSVEGESSKDFDSVCVNTER